MLAKNVHTLITASKHEKPWGTTGTYQSVTLVCIYVHILKN